MTKIKAVSVTYAPNDSLVVVDDRGRVWMNQSFNNQWVPVELPDEAELPGTSQQKAKEFFSGGSAGSNTQE